jgi:hypothetical protein
MRIAYITTDEVNQALVARLVAECGAVICTLLPTDQSPAGLFDAVLYDMDSMTKDQRSALLERLCSGPADRPTAVHGYGITAEQATVLNRAGVAVARRLHPRLLRRLLSAVRRGRETVPADDAGTELTWVNLVS